MLFTSYWQHTFLFSALYFFAVRVLRYRRVRALHSDYVGSRVKLSPAQAQKIIRVSRYLDMPYLVGRSTEFALFKTYGIPTISHLLNKTGQFAKKETRTKRAIDTGLLISTFLGCPISGPGSGAWSAVDPRNAIAVARINCLHARYEISNDDYLYTLSLFIYEPVRWTQKFGWRRFSRLECDASYTYWAEIGRRMGIKHIPPSFDEFQEWSEAYERNYMVPHEYNAAGADYILDLLLHRVPNAFGLKSLGRRIFICLLEERLRKAMMLPEQPIILVKAVNGLLRLHGFFCRNFCLPRMTPRYYVHPEPKNKNRGDTKVPRLHPEFYTSDPWYYPESTGIWKLWETVQIVIGVARPEKFAGPHFSSEGYRLEELGPAYFSKLEYSKVMKMAETIQGVPVEGPWSLDYEGGCPMSMS